MTKYGLFSRRLKAFVAFGEAPDRTTHLRFNLTKPYRPIFDFEKSVDPRSDIVNVCRLKTEPGTDKMHMMVIGRIVFSAWELEEVCPKALRLNEDESEASGLEEEDDVSSSRSASPSACESSESEDKSDDHSDYFEPTEQELIDACPDEFEFAADTFKLILSPDRVKHRLLLKAVTLDLIAAKVKRKKRFVQSSAGTIHIKKEPQSPEGKIQVKKEKR